MSGIWGPHRNDKRASSLRDLTQNVHEREITLHYTPIKLHFFLYSLLSCFLGNKKIFRYFLQKKERFSNFRFFSVGVKEKVNTAGSSTRPFPSLPKKKQEEYLRCTSLRHSKQTFVSNVVFPIAKNCHFFLVKNKKQ